MINLRYHIVSITAVFLALGIGLAFGAAFIDRATVDQLERNLTDIEDQNDALEQRNSELSGQLSVAEQVERGLRDEGLGELLDGRLDDVPVLVLASAGVDDEVVQAVEAAAIAAGAQVPGVLRVTDRFVLDDQSEIDDLRAILALPTAGEQQLRTAVTRQVRSVLAAAATPAAELPPDVVIARPVPAPPLLDALVGAGFLELDPADVPPDSFLLVPAADLRILAVSGPGAAVADAEFLLPVVDGLVAVDPTRPSAAPPVVVAAQPTYPDGDEAATDFVSPLRDDEAIRSRLSTVDHLDTFAGLVAAVLAVQHGIDGQLGHYGIGEGAQALLPALPDGAGG